MCVRFCQVRWLYILIHFFKVVAPILKVFAVLSKACPSLRYSTARILNFSSYAMRLVYHIVGLFVGLVSIINV